MTDILVITVYAPIDPTTDKKESPMDPRNLPIPSTTHGLVPWVADLFDQYVVDRRNETARGFADFAVERFGNKRAVSVVDSALALYSQYEVSLELVEELLRSNFGMHEIFVSCEAVLDLELDDTRENVVQMIRFRRYFEDVKESDDVADLIDEVVSDEGTLESATRKREFLAELIEDGRRLGTHELDVVRRARERGRES